MTTATRPRASTGRTGPLRRTPLPRVIRFCVVAFLGLRLATLAAALVAHGFPTLSSQGVPGWAAPPVHPGWTGLFSAFERFDALWFLRIASAGYRVHDGSAAFFPVFPLATRGVSFVLGGHPLAAATLVSNLAFVAALVAIFRLGEEAIGANGARFGVLLLCAAPTAYFFVMPYSESVYLSCVATSILAARRGRWGTAAVMGGLAAATRSIGVVLAPALLFEAFQQRREGRTRLGPVAALGPIAGTLAYAAWWQMRADDATIPLTSQQGWQRGFSWPWITIADATRFAIRGWGSPGGGYWILDLAIVAVTIVLAVPVATRLRPVYGAYVSASLLAPLLFVFPDRPLMSMPRFAATLFPITWIVAGLTERRPRTRVAILTVSAATMLVLCVLTVNWFYVF